MNKNIYSRELDLTLFDHFDHTNTERKKLNTYIMKVNSKVVYQEHFNPYKLLFFSSNTSTKHLKQPLG